MLVLLLNSSLQTLVLNWLCQVFVRNASLSKWIKQILTVSNYSQQLDDISEPKIYLFVRFFLNPSLDSLHLWITGIQLLEVGLNFLLLCQLLLKRKALIGNITSNINNISK